MQHSHCCFFRNCLFWLNLFSSFSFSLTDKHTACGSSAMDVWRYMHVSLSDFSNFFFEFNFQFKRLYWHRQKHVAEAVHWEFKYKTLSTTLHIILYFFLCPHSVLLYLCVLFVSLTPLWTHLNLSDLSLWSASIPVFPSYSISFAQYLSLSKVDLDIAYAYSLSATVCSFLCLTDAHRAYEQRILTMQLQIHTQYS